MTVDRRRSAALELVLVVCKEVRTTGGSWCEGRRCRGRGRARHQQPGLGRRGLASGGGVAVLGAALPAALVAAAGARLASSCGFFLDAAGALLVAVVGVSPNKSRPESRIAYKAVQKAAHR